MSQLLVDDIVNKNDTGSPGFSKGVIVTGVTTSTGFDGSGANLTSLPAANLTGTLPAISGASLTGIDNINEGNTKAEVVDTGSDGHFKVETEGSERLRITSSGNTGVGGLTTPGALLSIPAGASNTPRLAIESAVDDNDLTITQYEDGNGTYTMLGQNVKLDSGGNNAILDSGHKTAGIQLDARNHGAVSLLTGGTNAVDERLRITSVGRVLIGPGAIATPKCGYAGIDVPNYDYSIVMGGSDGSGNRADNTNKDSRFCGSHYVNAEEPIGIIRCTSGASNNEIHMGGGSSLINAATEVIFYTAANTTTTGGTERMRIDSSGRLMIGTTTEGEGNADNFTISSSGNTGMTIRSGTNNYNSIYFSDATSGAGEYDAWIQYHHGTGLQSFGVAGSERFVVTGSGQMFIGTANATADHNFGIGMLQVTNTTGYQHVQIDGHSDAAANATCLSIGRSRGTQASPTVLQNGDHIARLSANVLNTAVGTNFMGAACIDFYADKNHGSGDIPGYISFKTCHDGSASLTERVKIHSAGSMLFKSGLIEKNRAVGATLGATINTSLNDGNVVIFSGNESGNNTVNFQNVHTPMIQNSVVSFTVMIDPNNSGVINEVKIDGSLPAGGLKWQGGSQPTAGASGKDIYTFTINKYGTGATSYTVYGAKNNYA
tara:strand:- start:270 stop:2249 length:1980 start_codon:yes stop_codon:yes gene_type:complete